MKADFIKYTLNFKIPGGTSRGILHTKDSYFIIIREKDRVGIGECGILRGLSADDVPDYEKALKWTCLNIHLGKRTLENELLRFPSIYFGVEMALEDFKNGGNRSFFENSFSRGEAGQKINGLIWMGSESFMKEQIQSKIREGFRCLKMKIGALDWKSEREVLRGIRSTFSADQIEIRVDANGAFDPRKAKDVLEELRDLEVHSIEQPIKKGQWQEMASLCEMNTTPIALDEELIGLFDPVDRRRMMETIRPQYLVFKPSFIGGWSGTDRWIDLSQEFATGWWATSALESNIGLNAIAQFTASKDNQLEQGLGTGSLYTNNIPAPLEVKQGMLWMNKQKNWDVSPLAL